MNTLQTIEARLKRSPEIWPMYVGRYAEFGAFFERTEDNWSEKMNATDQYLARTSAYLSYQRGADILRGAANALTERIKIHSANIAHMNRLIQAIMASDHPELSASVLPLRTRAEKQQMGLQKLLDETENRLPLCERKMRQIGRFAFQNLGKIVCCGIALLATKAIWDIRSP